MFKSKLRKRILKIRKIANKNNIKLKFDKIFKLIKKREPKKKSIIGGYFPINFEVDDLDILKEFSKKKYQICLPVIKKNYKMDFYEWNINDPLKINKYGIPEPATKNIIYPDAILIPMVAFDRNLNRLGYGAGYYDRLIDKLSKKKKDFKNRFSISCAKN